MIDTKETLKNLHNEFPNMTLDDLFKILDCFKEDYTSVLTTPHYKGYEIINPANKKDVSWSGI